MFLSRISSGNRIAIGVGVIIALSLASCNSVIYDDLPACVPDYRVRLSYDYNMTNTERIHELEAAEIYAFDKDGNFVTSSIADKQTLIENDYTLPLNLQQNETYDLVIWGGLTEESPFRLDGTRAVTSKEDLTCRLITERDEEGNAKTATEFPGLFHSYDTFTFTTEDGYEEQTSKLKKNTNLLKVIIRKDSHSTIASDEFSVKVTDINGVMGHDNTVSGDEPIHYHSVNFAPGDFELADGQGNPTGEYSHGAEATIHLARLMASSEPHLIIKENDTNDIKADIKLMEVLLQAKDYDIRAKDMSDQEYLDRNEEYTLDITFHVTEQFIHVSIQVNGWEVVYQNIFWI